MSGYPNNCHPDNECWDDCCEVQAMSDEKTTAEQKKVLRLMRLSAEQSQLSQFQSLFNGHAWAAPPTDRETEAAKLVAKAQMLLHEQMEADRKGVLP